MDTPFGDSSRDRIQTCLSSSPETMPFYAAALIEYTQLINKNKTRERRSWLPVGRGERKCVTPDVDLNFSSFTLSLRNRSQITCPCGAWVSSLRNVTLAVAVSPL